MLMFLWARVPCKKEWLLTIGPPAKVARPLELKVGDGMTGLRRSKGRTTYLVRTCVGTAHTLFLHTGTQDTRTCRPRGPRLHRGFIHHPTYRGNAGTVTRKWSTAVRGILFSRASAPHGLRAHSSGNRSGRYAWSLRAQG
eukprot:1157989-Pelagomonas_calceolata.AAC.4